MVDVLHGVFRHDMAVPITSVLQEIELVAELIFRVFPDQRMTEDATGTTADIGCAVGVHVVSGGRGQGVGGVGGVDVDAVGAVVSVEGCVVMVTAGG